MFLVILLYYLSTCLCDCTVGGARCVAALQDADCNSPSGQCTVPLNATPIDFIIGNETESVVSYNGTCVCSDGAVGERCGEERLSGLTALSLSLLLGAYGVDRLYLGYTTIGIVKLAVSLLVCTAPCVPLCLRLCRRPSLQPSAAKRTCAPTPTSFCAAFCFVFFGVGIWWIWDAALIYRQQLGDARGCDLLDDL